MIFAPDIPVIDLGLMCLAPTVRSSVMMDCRGKLHFATLILSPKGADL